MYITILSLFFVRFLLYVVYVFALCSPYLEDNKVSIYLLNNNNNNNNNNKNNNNYHMTSHLGVK